MKNSTNEFSWENDIENKAKRDAYRDHLFTLVQNQDAAVRKEARKNIERLYNKYRQTLDRSQSRKRWRKAYEDLFPSELLERQINAYYQASDPAIKQSIVSSLYYPVLVLVPNHLHLIVDWLCDVAIHPSGNVRKAAVSLGTWIGFGADRKMGSYELDYSPKTHTSNDASLNESKRAHLRLVEKINQLIIENDIGYPKPFYWNDLKPSPYKSLYMLLEIVTRCWPGYVEEAYRQESEIDPDDPNLDMEKVMFVDRRPDPWEREGNMAYEAMQQLDEMLSREEFVWDDQSGVLAGQTMSDGTFIGTGAGGFSSQLRYFMYVPLQIETIAVNPKDQKRIKEILRNMLDELPARIELVTYHETYLALTILVDWKTAAQTASDYILIGLFYAGAPVYYCCYLTNTEVPSDDQIRNIITELQDTDEMDMSLLFDDRCFVYEEIDDFPNNPKQLTRHEEFMDKVRVADHYFHVMETVPAGARAYCKRLREVLAADPDFLDTYAALSEAYQERRGKKRCDPDGFTAEAYRRACQLITDKEGRWPKQMLWAWQENRHIMRALAHYAYLMWEKGKVDIALKIFRRLLQMNPNDNQGTRYEILAIRLGKGPHWHEEFAAADSPVEGLMDARATDDWFLKEAQKFPEEFKVFWDYAAELGKSD